MSHVNIMPRFFKQLLKSDMSLNCKHCLMCLISYSHKNSFQLTLKCEQKLNKNCEHFMHLEHTIHFNLIRLIKHRYMIRLNQNTSVLDRNSAITEAPQIPEPLVNGVLHFHKVNCNFCSL